MGKANQQGNAEHDQAACPSSAAPLGGEGSGCRAFICKTAASKSSSSDALPHVDCSSVLGLSDGRAGAPLLPWLFGIVDARNQNQDQKRY